MNDAIPVKAIEGHCQAIFRCPKCWVQLLTEEWCIPPYVLRHSTCPDHGPVWDIMEGVPEAVRNEVLAIPAPHYRWTVPQLGPLYEQWVARLRVTWALNGEPEGPFGCYFRHGT